jgi:hypothetical protein
MLDYVLKQSDHSDEMYDFLNWSASYPYFLDAGGKITREYEGAIRGYFNKTDRGALNKRNVWLKLKGTPNRSFKKVYDDIRLAQSNPIIRFIKKNRKMLIQFGGIVVGVAALTIGGIFAFQSWSGPSEPVQQEPKTEDNAGKQQPAAPADKTGQQGGQSGTQQGGQTGTQSGQTGTSGANAGSGTSAGTGGQTANPPASSTTPSGTSQTGTGGARP